MVHAHDPKTTANRKSGYTIQAHLHLFIYPASSHRISKNREANVRRSSQWNHLFVEREDGRSWDGQTLLRPRESRSRPGSERAFRDLPIFCTACPHVGVNQDQLVARRRRIGVLHSRQVDRVPNRVWNHSAMLIFMFADEHTSPAVQSRVSQKASETNQIASSFPDSSHHSPSVGSAKAG